MQSKLDVSPPSNTTDGEAGGVKISPNTDYLRTIPAIVKLVEFIVLLLAFSFVASFKNGIDNVTFTNSWYSWGELHFQLFVTVVAWLGTIVMFLLYFLNIINLLKVKIPHFFIMLTAVHIIGAFFLLLSSSLVLDSCIKLRRRELYVGNELMSFCNGLSKVSATSCGVLEFGGTLGLFCCFIVGFDAFMHALKAVSEYRQYAANRSGQQEPQHPDKEMNDPNPTSEY